MCSYANSRGRDRMHEYWYSIVEIADFLAIARAPTFYEHDSNELTWTDLSDSV